MRRFLLPIAVAAACSAACGGPIHGTRTNRTDVRPGAAVATTFASDPFGLRVLVNDNSGDEVHGLLATSASEFDALWSDLGLETAPPRIQFATHVVLATSFMDGVCQPELVAASVDATGVLTFEERSIAPMCIELGARVLRVVAIPRAILPAHFTWRTQDGDFAFDLAPRSATAIAPPMPVDSGRRSKIALPRGIVAVPAVGHIALRSLDDGRQVWVAHRSAGDVSVVVADLAVRTRVGIRAAVHWNPKSNRFTSDHDSRGRSVHGRRSLDTLAFAHVDETHIEIGESFALADDIAVLARASEPALEGTAMAYDAELTPPTSFVELADNRIGLVVESIVVGTSGPARLCVMPDGNARRSLPGCSDSAPTIPAIRVDAEPRTGITMTSGPVVVRKRGNSVDLLIELGSAESGWRFEH